MGSEGRPAYYIALRRKGRGWEVSYHVGSEERLTVLLRLNGKSAERIFRGIVQALAKQGAVIPSRVSGEEEVYAVREDLGPVVGAYLILVRRARDLDKWESFLNNLLGGQYAGVAKALSTFLEMAIDLSRSLPSRGRRYSLSPIVVEALSTSMRHFVDRITRARP